MRTNWHVALQGKRLLLVPYRRRHVERYHHWMVDPWIQKATASEPLTLEQEYAMQIDWRDDPHKCTFIVLVKPAMATETTASNTALAVEGAAQAHAAENDVPLMIGDVNLFFGGDYDDPSAAEVEVMIAEPLFRGKGYAQEAVKLLMRYGVESLGVTRYFCKIGEDNAKSLQLFKALGFTQCNYVAAFREVELQYRLDDGGADRIRAAAAHMQAIAAPDASSADAQLPETEPKLD